MWDSAFICVLALAAAAAAAAAQHHASGPLYKEVAAPIEARVDDLLRRMTMEEKTAQLVQGDMRNWINVTDGTFNASGLEWNMKTRAGSFYVYSEVDSWHVVSEGVKRAQEYLQQHSRLGIPALVQNEGVHGHVLPNLTIFNSPIGFACAFNPALVEKMARLVAAEARALGVNNLFAPVLDLARELRFGRVEETFGEDPYLAGETGYHFVMGLQSGKVAAMVKHFVGFATPEQGLNTGPVHGGRRELLTTYLPAFKRAIIDAGALSIMSAYHSYDGYPAVADRYTLTDVLRGAWGYRYFVMSDSGATDRLCTAFSMCETKPMDSAAIISYTLPSGNDVEMGGGSYSYQLIPELVRHGKLSVEVVDEAVRRLLRAKFTLGLFEEPYSGVPESEQCKHLHTPEAVAVARELDTESIVLLENAQRLLPLEKTAHVAVIGPMADFMNYGDYVAYKSYERGITPLAGIRAASMGKVTYAKGCERWSNERSGFAEAVAKASAADVAVVVVGTWSRDQGELWTGLNATTGEHIDTASLKLVGAMPHLVAAIIATGTPTVVVFSSGKPITEPWISDAASALVQQFYPSEQGGHALADVLFGNANPSGKLVVGFPHDIGTMPVYYDHLNGGRPSSPSSSSSPPSSGTVHANGTLTFGSGYVLASPQPLYEFGYGLSYSTFLYSHLRLSRRQACATDSVRVSVRVRNSSGRDGAEVVQLYVKDVISSVVVPNLQLKAFAKVHIRSGRTETVKLHLNVSDLGLWDRHLEYVVEPGRFIIFVGSSSKDLRLNATLTVV